MRVALMTGETKGIGAAISVKLKETVYKVAAIYSLPLRQPANFLEKLNRYIQMV